MEPCRGYLRGQEPVRGGEREWDTMAAQAVLNTDRSDYLFNRELPESTDIGKTYSKCPGQRASEECYPLWRGSMCQMLTQGCANLLI